MKVHTDDVLLRVFFYDNVGLYVYNVCSSAWKSVFACLREAQAGMCPHTLVAMESQWTACSERHWALTCSELIRQTLLSHTPPHTHTLLC